MDVSFDWHTLHRQKYKFYTTCYTPHYVSHAFLPYFYAFTEKSFNSLTHYNKLIINILHYV